MPKVNENSYTMFKEAKTNIHFHYQDFNGIILILTITNKFKTSAINCFCQTVCTHFIGMT